MLANMTTTLGECVVFAGIRWLSYDDILWVAGTGAEIKLIPPPVNQAAAWRRLF